MNVVATLFDQLEYFQMKKRNIVSKERLISVDALRGFDMLWIIGARKIFKALNQTFNNSFTNALYSQLEHAEWLGLTFYDIIMPLFLFLVGISMVYSFRKRLSHDPSLTNLWKHISIRFVVLWILGMAVQGNLLSYDLEEIKIYSNTLQAIAAGYLIAALFVLHLSISRQIIFTIVLMLLYWGIMSLVPTPGFGVGLYSPEGNFAIYLDKLVLGGFQDGTTYTWLLSSLNFGATTMLGVFTGYLLQSTLKPLSKLYRLLIAGIVLILLGQVWGIVHPSIKHLWTSSFVLISGGICLLLLGLFFLIIDVLKYKKWSLFFIVIGSNAIFAYVSANIFDYRLIAKVFVGGLEKYIGLWYSSVLALGGFTILFLLLLYMYRHKIVIKI